MKKDLLVWSIVTAVIITAVYFLLNQFTTNDIYILIAFAIIGITSIIIFVRKDSEKAFRSGGIIGLVCIIAMILCGDMVSLSLTENLINVGVLIGIFLIGGFVGYILRKKEVESM